MRIQPVVGVITAPPSIKSDYIHSNLGKAGLCNLPKNYAFLSAGLKKSNDIIGVVR
jgi:hypothetical protein